MPRRSWLLALDVAAVLVFVALGRMTHDSGSWLSGYVETAAPFLMGLAAGWLATRAWRDAIRPSVGLGIVMATVAVGMLLRRLVWDGGTAVSFVLVTTVFLTLLLMGWRLGVRCILNPPGSSSGSPGSTAPRS